MRFQSENPKVRENLGDLGTWEDNIKMDFRDIWHESMGWMQLTEDGRH
jgi:hypothetical protein